MARASIVIFAVVALLTTLFMIRLSQGQAAPGSPTDQTQVPHYFGPWPNWALSPLTLSDVQVTITGDGTGATATASVGVDGAITGVTVTDPGAGYSQASTSVTIDGAGTGAAATAVVQASGGVSAVTVTDGGANYTKPTVVITGGGATTDATATPYGHLDALTVTNAGSGYRMPTVDFDMPDDPDGTLAVGHVTWDQTDGHITGIVIDDPGSGYASAPNVVIRDGTLMDPIRNEGAGATAVATIAIDTIGLDTFGAGYTSPPSVTIADTGAGLGATATAAIAGGIVSAVDVTAPGSGYVAAGGIRKFQDALPVLCDPAGAGCPTTPDAKFIPLGVPAAKIYNGLAADEYDIAILQYRTSFSSDMPATLVRGYVQLETPDNASVSQHFPLVQYNRDGTTTPLLDAHNQPILAVTPPQWLGPTIVAQKNKPVRIRFHNLLPTGAEGDLFLPVDSTMMGSGMGPMAMAAPVNNGSVMDEVRNPVCSQAPKSPECFKDNRATLHLHGGITPWISDGTPHQWITPAGENTEWPQGVSVSDVPDMAPRDVPDDGIQTFYYTNQQGARLMFYHDHSWGITRLNVYAGEAAGYLIGDAAEQRLLRNNTIPSDQIPLVVQDRTFVPQDNQLYDQKDAQGDIVSYGQDPTWDKARWGGYGNFWYHHVYMPAQNPGDSSGMGAYGRWMYGPWFWPPASDIQYGPIDNPYYDPACDPARPATWQYQTDPFCEPAKIPGTPNISAGMEQFNDTPVVNGVAYPTVTLQPKSYRLRILNAANDRFFNFQWYVADPATASAALNRAGQPIGGTEVALDPQLLAAAQKDPLVFPTPVQSAATAGPDWIQIGSEGGFLPAPVVVDGQQPTTWITDPARFDFGNVDKHSLLLAPAERADVVVDFSRFAGKTLILYNDAPAAFPARIPSYDYYTGAPDLSPIGAPGVLPGYGPNTRTVMQVKIAAVTPGPTFNLAALRNAFSHKADGSGVFESSQKPIIVGQAPYNSAYGSSFVPRSDCNDGTAQQDCDGLVRVDDTTEFGFNTLVNPKVKTTLHLEPKAIQDETGEGTFDEFGRMVANLGVEAQPATPGLQNSTLYPYVNPATELIDGTDLPKMKVTYDADGEPVSDVRIMPLSDATADDGTQIWRITHNGVDTHPIHFHLYDVQLINHVTWDNIIIPPDKEELGWKDTVRVPALEDTIVAIRPIVPEVPFEVPNAIRKLNPMMPDDSPMGFVNIDPQGNPTNPITNQLVNYGWEYVWHCHILSHEEMDMMRPVSLVLPPRAADGLAITPGNGAAQISFNDNSINETSFDIQRDDGTGFATIGTIDSPLALPNVHESRTFTDTTYDPNVTYSYRIVAKNTAGYGNGLPQTTAQSISAAVTSGPAPAAPTDLTWTFGSVDLAWTDNATDETGFTIQRADNGGPFVTIATRAANTAADPTVTGPVTYRDTTAQPGNSYIYRIRADRGGASSAWLTSPTIRYPAVPAAPTSLTATLVAGPNGRLDWAGTAADGQGYTEQYVVERAPHGTTTWTTLTGAVPAGTLTYTDASVAPGDDWDYRVAVANSASGMSPYSNVARLTVPSIPAAPTGIAGTPQATASRAQVLVTWTDNAGNETGLTLQRSSDGGASFTTIAALAANATSFTDPATVAPGSYIYRVNAFNLGGTSAWNTSAAVVVPPVPAAPSGLAGVVHAGPSVTLTWTDNAANEAGFTLQRSSDGGTIWTTVQASLPPNTAGWVDTGVSLGVAYVYRARAFNVSGVSGWNVSAAVAVPTMPAAPTNLARAIARTAAGPDTVTLTWVDNAGNETGFTVQRATNSAFTANLVTFAAAANATSAPNPVAHGFTYYYRVQAVNVVGVSAWSNVVSATTVPATPTNLRATSITRTALTLNWNDVSANETGYQVQRKRAASNTWQTIRTTGPGATSYRVTGLSRNTSYDFRIRGVNGVGNSPWSASIRVRTLR